MYQLKRYFDDLCGFIGMLIMIVIGGTVGGTVLCAVLIAAAPLAIVVGLLFVFGLRANLSKIGDCIEASIVKSKEETP